MDALVRIDSSKIAHGLYRFRKINPSIGLGAVSRVVAAAASGRSKVVIEVTPPALFATRPVRDKDWEKPGWPGCSDSNVIKDAQETLLDWGGRTLAARLPRAGVERLSFGRCGPTEIMGLFRSLLTVPFSGLPAALAGTGAFLWDVSSASSCLSALDNGLIGQTGMSELLFNPAEQVRGKAWDKLTGTLDLKGLAWIVRHTVGDKDNTSYQEIRSRALAHPLATISGLTG